LFGCGRGGGEEEVKFRILDFRRDFRGGDKFRKYFFPVRENL
jgi:hypothetical protein